jgi:LPXTG-motif cell wall-anchored protein
LAAALVIAVGVAGLAVDRAGADSVTPHPSDTAYVLSDVHCSPSGNGVLDITLVNDSELVNAQFLVDGSDAASSAAVLVAPSSAHALSFTNLADGDLAVPVRVDGANQVVRATVNCDLPRLTSPLEAQAVSGAAPVRTAELPRTGADIGGFIIGGVLVSAGIAASLLARRRYF